MTVWQTEGRCFKGILLIKRDGDDTGLRILRTALDELRETGSILRDSAFLCALAEGLGGTGQVAEGLAAVDQALKRSENSEERWCIAELLRVKGELILLENGGSLPASPRLGAAARRLVLGTPRRHEPRADVEQQRPDQRGTRSAGAGL